MLGKKYPQVRAQGEGGKRAQNRLLTSFNLLLFPCSSLDTNRRGWQTFHLNLLHVAHPPASLVKEFYWSAAWPTTLGVVIDTVSLRLVSP